MKIRNSIKTIISVLILGSIFLLSFSGRQVLAENRFSDVTDSAEPFYDSVYWAAENNITKGFSDGTFRPDEGCTREQFVTFIWRLMGRPEPSASDVSFVDIDSSMSTYRAIMWASGQDIIKGFDDGTFRPEDEVLREQVAIMLWRLAGRPEAVAAQNSFTDISESNPGYQAILWGGGKGLIKGADGRFMPDDLCLRKHIVIFLYRYYRDIINAPKYKRVNADAVNASGQNISGEFYIPDAQNGITIIWCHGLGGTGEGSCEDNAAILAEQGITGYVFDFCGGGLDSQSDGSTLDMSVLTEVEDLKAVYEMVSKQSFVDPDRIYIAGHSQGSLVAGIYAARYPENPKGLILLSSAFCIPDWVRIQFPKYSDIRDSYNLLGEEKFQLGRRFAEDVYYMDGFSAVKGYPGRVILIHAKDDKSVPYEDVEKARGYFNDPEVNIYETGGHLLDYGEAERERINDILGFLGV